MDEEARRIISGLSRENLNDAFYEAVSIGNKPLINYLLRRSPEAKKGCNSEHVKLLALLSAFSSLYSESPSSNKGELLDDIMQKCKLDPYFIFSLSLAAQDEDLKKKLREAAGTLNQTEEKFAIPPGTLAMRYEIKPLTRKIIGNLKKHPMKGVELYIDDVLAYAGLKGDLETIRYFVENFPKIDLDTAMFNAVRKGNQNIIDYLISNASPRESWSEIDPNIQLDDFYGIFDEFMFYVSTRVEDAMEDPELLRYFVSLYGPFIRLDAEGRGSIYVNSVEMADYLIDAGILDRSNTNLLAYMGKDVTDDGWKRAFDRIVQRLNLTSEDLRRIFNEASRAGSSGLAEHIQDRYAEEIGSIES